MFNGKTYYGEVGYLQMMGDVLARGADVPDRTGVGSRAMFDAKLIFPAGVFPFSTVRSAPLWMAFEEFWMFMRGETQTKALEAKGIRFWKGNTSREFLDKRGLSHLDEGDMGMAYGFQWRGYNRELSEHVIDQLKETIDTLKKDPYSRRIYTTLWNPSASKFMALTPCWHSHQFVVLPDENGEKVLHMKLLNRSLDTLFGLQFAVQQYKLYQMAVAKMLGFKCGALSCDLTQFHLYQNQFEYAAETLTRDLGVAGEVEITKELNSLEDMLAMTWEDIRVTGLEVNDKPYVAKRPPMAA